MLKGIWWRHKIWVSKILKFGFLENKKSLQWTKNDFSEFHICSLLHLKKQTSKNVVDAIFLCTFQMPYSGANNGCTFDMTGHL